MGKIEDMGNIHVVGKDIEQWYKLLPISPSASDMDVVMDSSDSGATPRTAIPIEQADPDDIPLSGDESMTKPHDNTIVSFIDVIGRVRLLEFLSGSKADLAIAVPRGPLPDTEPLQRFHQQHRRPGKDRQIHRITLHSIRLCKQSSVRFPRADHA